MLGVIKHRVNSLDALHALASGLGAEIDLRSRGSEIVLNHEPYCGGESFSEFLRNWALGRGRGTLILNPKEDGLETQTLELLKQFQVRDFFFLDLTLPTLVRLAVRQQMGKVAVRVSEYETVQSALCLQGHAEWAWLDCFGGKPLSPSVLGALKGKFRLCLVSPELQGYPRESVSAFLHLAHEVDAVCTKYPEGWQGVA